MKLSDEQRALLAKYRERLVAKSSAEDGLRLAREEADAALLALRKAKVPYSAIARETLRAAGDRRLPRSIARAQRSLRTRMWRARKPPGPV